MSYDPNYPHYAPQPPPPKKSPVGKILGFGCLGIVGLFIFIGIITTITGTSSDDGGGKSDTVKDVPAYVIVDKDATGNKRNVVVEVKTTKNLKAVFSEVTKSLTDEAGYYIMINCSTGGTKTVDNRLANGQYAIGRLGVATTGLGDGKSEFSTNRNRTCPVSTADEAKPTKKKHTTAPTKKPKPKPDVVTFRVWGNAPAGALGPLDITYGSDSDSRDGTFKNGTFTATLPVDDDAMYFNVTAQLQGSGDINCSVTVNGETDKAHASGDYNICTAQLSSGLFGGWS